MSRDLDPSEYYFWLLDQVSSMNFVVMAELTQTFSTTALEQALYQLQAEFQHETVMNLQIQATPQGELHFKTVPSLIQLEQLISAQPAHEVFAEYLPQRFKLNAPLVRAFYLQDPEGHHATLALLFNHAIADGKTGMSLLQHWLSVHAQLLTEPDANYQVQPVNLSPEKLQANTALHRLLPTFFKTLGQEDLSDTPEAQLLELFEQKKLDIRRFGRPEPLALMQNRTGLSQPLTLAIELSPAQQQQLRETCRTRHCSVHGALMAAQLIALKQVEVQTEAQTFCLTSPVDLRRFFDKAEYKHGMYTALLSSTYRIDQSTEFWPLAQQASQEIKMQIARGDASHFYHIAQADKLRLTPEMMTQFELQTLKTTPQSLISNIGVLPDIGLDYVRQLSFALCPMPFQPLFTAVTCYKNALRLNITYDQTQIKSQTAQILADAIQHQLLQQTVSA